MKKTAIIGSPLSHDNYRLALRKAGCDAVIFPDCSYLQKHPAAFDALLLPGGGDVAKRISDYPFVKSKGGLYVNHPDGYPWICPDINSASFDLAQLAALDLFFRAGKPVFGICKGMQLINLYFCGTIGEVSNHSLHQRRGRDAFHPAKNQPGSFLYALFGAHMIINSNHHQCIHKMGENLQIIQRSPDNVPEAITHLSAPVIGTQWHPERMPQDGRQDAGLLFRYFVSLL